MAEHDIHPEGLGKLKQELDSFLLLAPGFNSRDTQDLENVIVAARDEPGSAIPVRDWPRVHALLKLWLARIDFATNIMRGARRAIAELERLRQVGDERPALRTQPCEGCARPIVFGRSENGKPVPLDTIAPVYRFRDGRWSRARDAFVSHFVTCPHRERFSKGGAK